MAQCLEEIAKSSLVLCSTQSAIWIQPNVSETGLVSWFEDKWKQFADAA